MEQEIETLKMQIAQMQKFMIQGQNQPQTLLNTVPSPEVFSFDKDEWPAWIQHYERYRLVAKLEQTEDIVQMNNLLLYMGPKVSKLLETLKKKETDFTSYKEMKDFFDKQFVGTKNIVYARAKFNLCYQKEGQSAQDYVSDLIFLAKSCDFRVLEDELIRDRLVVGIRDAKLSETLQMDSSLTLDRAIEKITQSQQIKKYIIEGWPDKKKIKNNVQEYYKYRKELTIMEELLCYGDRLLIPKSLRKPCLVRIHDGHFGLNRCIRRVKETIWWPSINQQVEDVISSCEICLKNQHQHVEPMIAAEVPTRPWSVIGADLAEYKSNMFLVVQDYYSKYPEVRKLRKITSASIVKSFKQIFSSHGIPDIVRSDNGRQFVSHEFKQFANQYGFQWISSSPEYQQSNGQAESAVKLLKRILKKNPEDMDLALLAYRNTTLSCGASPAQLLYGRSLRDRLPSIKKKLIPKIPDHNKIKEKMLEEKKKQKTNYDIRHRVREKKDSREGDKVWMINMQREGMVEQKLDEPRSYLVRTDRGNTVRRNSRHLQVLPKPSTSTSSTSNQINQPEESKGSQVSERGRPKRVLKAPKYLSDYI